MTDFWQLLGSYQWERSFGDNTGAIATASQTFSDTGPNGFGRDPNDLVNSYGPQYANSAHVIRVAGNFTLPKGFNLGAQESFETGRPYGRIVTVANLGQGTRSILAEPRGAYRLPATNNLQARVGKDFSMGRRRLRLSVDIYNILKRRLAADGSQRQHAAPRVVRPGAQRVYTATGSARSALRVLSAVDLCRRRALHLPVLPRGRDAYDDVCSRGRLAHYNCVDVHGLSR